MHERFGHRQTDCTLSWRAATWVPKFAEGAPSAKNLAPSEFGRKEGGNRLVDLVVRRPAQQWDAEEDRRLGDDDRPDERTP